jgi:hypothetical protein
MPKNVLNAIVNPKTEKRCASTQGAKVASGGFPRAAAAPEEFYMAISKRIVGFVCAWGLIASAAWAEASIVQAVVTKEPCANFEAAKAKAVTQVKDGDPVYLNLLFPKAVDKYLAAWDELPNAGIEGKKLFLVEIGEAGGTESWGYNLILPAPGEVSGNFACFAFAPGKVTPVWRGIWLKTVGEGAPGVWKNELRLYDKGDSRDGERRLLVRVPLTANVGQGVSKYAAMLADYKKRNEAGDAAFNEAPAKGGLVDKAAIKAALAEAANAMDETPEGAYFIESDWYIHNDTWGNQDYLHAMAVVLYHRDGKSWMRQMDVRKWTATKRVEAALQSKELELSADNYKKALGQSQVK